MKLRQVWVTLILLVFSSGCDKFGCKELGGGIAGAGRDSGSRRRAVDNYEGMRSPLIRVSVFDNPPLPTPKQHFPDILRSFPISVERVDERIIHIPHTNFRAQYKRNRFKLRNGDTVVIEEQLPAVFNMHPLRIGVGTLGGRGIVMLINKSRSSTGRYFVAIYGQDGEDLYKRVLRTGDVWDVKATADAIDLIGAKKTRRITIKKTE